ncbi:hypothetical protein ACWEQ0_26220 [Nocardia thailandica]
MNISTVQSVPGARRGARWAVAAAAAAVLLTGCGAEVAPPALPSGDPAPPGASFAYRTGNELAVVRGTETLRAPGSFGYAAGGAAFTADGRVAFTVESGSKTLVAVDVRDGTVQRVDCGCTEAVAVRDGVVAWWHDPGKVMSLDLADAAAVPAVSRTVDFPEGEDGARVPAGEVRILAATPTHILLARVESRGLWWEKSHLYVIGTVSSMRALGRIPEVDAQVSATPGPDGNSFLLVGTAGRTASCGTAHAAVLNAADGAIEPLPALPGQCSSVSFPRWGADGVLTVAARQWADSATAAVNADRLRREGDSWVPVADHPVVDVLRQDPAVVEVIASGEVGRSADVPHGDLFIERAGSRVQLATGVMSLSAPPSS